LVSRIKLVPGPNILAAPSIFCTVTFGTMSVAGLVSRFGRITESRGVCPADNCVNPAAKACPTGPFLSPIIISTCASSGSSPMSASPIKNNIFTPRIGSNDKKVLKDTVKPARYFNFNPGKLNNPHQLSIPYAQYRNGPCRNQSHQDNVHPDLWAFYSFYGRTVPYPHAARGFRRTGRE